MKRHCHRLLHPSQPLPPFSPSIIEGSDPNRLEVTHCRRFSLQQSFLLPNHNLEQDEFGFMNVKRVEIACLVIAGRIGCDSRSGDKDDPGYDSLVGREPGASQTRLDEEDELIMFNPRVVLPCFVIVYDANMCT
ncbi:hypothetical protein L2E82_12549 [Cichorium intybus]|uniref:Uncharacterized protein n=1 Tax=Cichorium intybus TaxID=13427 RepID=A0ACB9GHM6_CICIN|nr:hypothetical protein L2E82_12549 [Cichorium intybus]